MRLYRANFSNLSAHIEKMKKGELTLENVLEEDDIINDLKSNPNSQFLSLISNEAIRKLIDYATKMPTSDDQKVGHKFPFNAAELLCADNSGIQDRLMNEINLKDGDSDEEDDEDDKKEKKTEETNGVEKKEEKDEEKKSGLGLVDAINQGINGVKEADKEKPPEETKPEEPKPEEETKPEEPKKEEETKPEETKTEETKPEEPKTEETKSEETKTEEAKPEEAKPEETKPEEAKAEENKAEETKENDGAHDSEEKGQQRHKSKIQDEGVEESTPEKGDENNEESEKSDKDDEKTTTIYDNVDYLLGFLKESEETKGNYVLVGYFYKILNHLINTQSSKIVQYIFDYPKKDEFDVLELLVEHLNRKSMGQIVNKLLLFSEEQINDLDEKKMNLVEKIINQLEKTTKKEKYDCICDTLISVINNKSFFTIFMKQVNLVKSLLNILDNSLEDVNKTNAVMNLLIKINENILKNFEEHYTPSLTQENPLEFMNMFSYDVNYPLDDKTPSAEEMNEILKALLQTLFSSLKTSQFKFLDDLCDYSSEKNKEFMTTYHQMQKRIGVKKLIQVEYFRTLLDIFVNSYALNFYKSDIEELIKIASEKKIFNNLHKLFFDFPFCNIYQTFYNQIMDIVLTNVTPQCLTEPVFKNVKDEKNLIDIYLDDVLNNLKFTFVNSNNVSFNPCLSFELTLLNKIINTQNEIIKDYCDRNLSFFNEYVGKEMTKIYDQKLLLSDNQGTNFGGMDDDKPLEYFGKNSFMQVLDEDLNIYKEYLKGGDHQKLYEEKLERERIEKEKENEMVDDNEENKDENVFDNDEYDARDEREKKDDEEEEDKNEEKNEEKNDDKNKENAGELFDAIYGNEDSSTEESNDEKKYNDANFWNKEPTPNEEIMNEVMKELDL